MANLLPAWKMRGISIGLVVVAVATLPVACGSTESGNMAQPPTSPALSMRLTEPELTAQKALANNGDCAAALKVARHYSFVVNDFNESISWLRIAAKCPQAEPKAELAYLLLGGKMRPGVVEEIESLIVQIGATNPRLAEDVRREARAKLGNPGG